MAQAQKQTEQKEAEQTEQKKAPKLNKDGFPAGQRVSPKELAKFRAEQRKKARK